MQLGTRWTVGDTPPARLPETVVAAVREVEASLPEADRDARWTLTWLEGKPVCELDTGHTIRYDATADRALVTMDDDGADGTDVDGTGVDGTDEERAEEGL